MAFLAPVIGEEIVSKFLDETPVNKFVDASKEVANNALLETAEKVPILGSIIKKGAEELGKGEDWVADKIRSGVEGFEKFTGIDADILPEHEKAAQDLIDKHTEIEPKGKPADPRTNLEIHDKFPDAIDDIHIPHEELDGTLSPKIPVSVQNMIKNVTKPLNFDGSLNFGEGGFTGKTRLPIIRKILDPKGPYTLAEKQELFSKLPENPYFRRMPNKYSGQIANILTGAPEEFGPTEAEAKELMEKLKTETIEESEPMTEEEKKAGGVFDPEEPMEPATPRGGLKEPVPPSVDELPKPPVPEEAPKTVSEELEDLPKKPESDKDILEGLGGKVAPGLKEAAIAGVAGTVGLAAGAALLSDPKTQKIWDKLKDSPEYKALEGKLELLGPVLGVGSDVYQLLNNDPKLSLKSMQGLLDMVTKLNDAKKRAALLKEERDKLLIRFNSPVPDQARNRQVQNNLTVVERNLKREERMEKSIEEQIKKTSQIMARKSVENDKLIRQQAALKKAKKSPRTKRAIKSGVIRPSAMEVRPNVINIKVAGGKVSNRAIANNKQLQ